ncbi:MAG: DUF418 domain-containing protein, partial [Bacteroidota bacterium]|nr:DUF418 domain-containing protein [Bacteroidota bacterium]
MPTLQTFKLAPVSGQERLFQIDSLRGFASLGIILVNIYAFSGYGWMPEEQMRALPTARWDQIIATILNVLINTKFITLFSILFGTGFYLQLERAQQQSLNFQPYFAKRMLILMLLACIHAYVIWYGDIIRYYAAAGLLLILVRNWSPRKIIWLCIIFSVPVTGLVFILKSAIDLTPDNYPSREQILNAFKSSSYRQMLQMNWRIDPVHNFLLDSPITITSVTGKILLGFWLGQIGFFRSVDRYSKLLQWWIWGGLTVGLTSSVAYWAIESGYLSLDSPWLLWVPFAVAGGLICHSLFYLAAFLRLHEKFPEAVIFRTFAVVGKMALSNYIGQTLLCMFIFYPSLPGFKLMGKVGPVSLLVISLIVFLVQVIISRFWLKYHQQGPLEQVWKNL